MSKRGIQGCPQFCTGCAVDCRCQTCGYCHSCNSNSFNSYGGHTWSHACTGSTGTVSTSVTDGPAFPADISERFLRFFETEPFTLELSTEKKLYVHKDALANKSAVLKRQVESEMKEATTKIIKLEDTADNETAIGMFVQFSYLGNYTYDESVHEDALLVHAQVYVYAEKIEALELKSLALKKATKLCSDASNGQVLLLKVLQFALPEAIVVVYEGTYDAESGKLPSVLEEKGAKDKLSIPAFTRDGFRMLLAWFAASYIDELRKMETFMTALAQYPTLGADVLMFTGKGTAISTDGGGNLKFY